MRKYSVISNCSDINDRSLSKNYPFKVIEGSMEAYCKGAYGGVINF